MSKEKMSLSKWYGSSVRIPDFGSYHYTGFCASCIGVVRSIVEDNIGKRIAVRFGQGGTASADQERALININIDLAYGRFPGHSYIDNQTSIAAVLGIIVHEAAHFAYSPKTLLPYYDYIRSERGKGVNAQVAKLLGNVIEDIYIEAEVDRQVPSLTWTLDTLNDIMFDGFAEEKAVSGVRDVQNAPLNLDDVARVLSFLIFAKTRESLKVNPYVDELFALVRSATELVTQRSRFELCNLVYGKLMENLVVLDEQEDGEGEKGEGEGGEGEKGEGKSGEGDKSLDSASSDVRGLTADHDADKDKPDKGYATFSKDKKMNSMVESLEGIKVVVNADDEAAGETHSPSALVMETPLALGSPLTMDSRYVRLAEIGRQHAVVNRPYGQDTNRGTNIRKLYRIATDNKIFAETVKTNQYKPMQVIILVDCSGSMESFTKTGERSITAALRAALGAAYGLTEARCDVAVYGHTAETMGNTEVIIYVGKEFREPIDHLAARFGHLNGNEKLWQNRDGYAIRHVAKKFTDSRKRRLLIVISDGMPEAGFGYRGLEGITHTKRIVDGVRKQGIDVLSISITEAAKGNDRIYGKRNNVFNEDPNVIEEVVRTLVLK